MSDEDDKKKTEGATLEEQLAAALADAEKWKGLSRKNEERATSNAEKAKKFDEHEEANRTELEKMQARAEAAEKAVQDRDAKDASVKLRDDIAKEKKFDERKISASALRGGTREELEAHADELLALIPAPATTASAEGQGANGTVIGEGELSVDDIVQAATAR
ncbi:hypothetical protein [Curtobacterium sp. AB7]|uniref:hypothetical protein n=1 Tax=Curtobacterium sp. AB7 TaxID=3349327 RepID=UPI003839230A